MKGKVQTKLDNVMESCGSTEGAQVVDGEVFFTVKDILDKRVRKGRIEYRVEWEGDQYEEDDKFSWEPVSNIVDASLIDAFERKQELEARANRRQSKPREKPVPYVLTVPAVRDASAR